MTGEPLSAGQKALQLNLDRNWYGTIAEIGAGQESRDGSSRWWCGGHRRQDDQRVRHDGERRHIRQEPSLRKPGPFGADARPRVRLAAGVAGATRGDATSFSCSATRWRRAASPGVRTGSAGSGSGFSTGRAPPPARSACTRACSIRRHRCSRRPWIARRQPDLRGLVPAQRPRRPRDKPGGPCLPGSRRSGLGRGVGSGL